MQTAGYTITPHDAEVFRDLVTFLGEDVFDQRQRPENRSQLQRLMRYLNLDWGERW